MTSSLMHPDRLVRRRQIAAYDLAPGDELFLGRRLTGTVLSTKRHEHTTGLTVETDAGPLTTDGLTLVEVVDAEGPEAAKEE